MPTFTREVYFSPAFDKRHQKAEQDYGICPALGNFILRGEKGAVRWSFSTGWYLKSTPIPQAVERPQSYNVSYHSYIPVRFLESDTSADCYLLLDSSNGKCYGDDVPIMDHWELGELLISEGSEAVWKKLEEVYNQYLEPLDIEEVNMAKKAK